MEARVKMCLRNVVENKKSEKEKTTLVHYHQLECCNDSSLLICNNRYVWAGRNALTILVGGGPLRLALFAL